MSNSEPTTLYPTLDLFGYYRTQLASWPMAAANFRAISSVETRILPGEGFRFTLQHNPARVRSTAAKVDSAAIAARPCFLCAANRPPEQQPLPVPGMDYEVLVNPFPIFPFHFTIPCLHHTPQLITANNAERFTHMMQLAAMMPGMALFYNGPACGASAPDHFHFQALPLQSLPLLTTTDPLPFLTYGGEFTSPAEATAWFRHLLPHLPIPSASPASSTPKAAHAPSLSNPLTVERATLAASPSSPTPSTSELEPRINLYATYSDDLWKVLVLPRLAHRPDFYGDGPDQFLISPASVDLAGTLILPSPSDFARFTPADLHRLLSQTTYPA